MDGSLERLLLRLGELEAEGLARMRDRVVDAQAFAARLDLPGEGIVGGAHVGVFRVRGYGGDDLGREHRIASRRILEGRVGVPEAIAERVHAAPVVGADDLAVLVEVRDVAEGLVAEAVLLERADPQLGVEHAVQPLGEIELLVVGERLVAEDEHGVLVHPRPDACEGFRVVRLAQIDGTHLGGEHGMERAGLQFHGGVLLGQASVTSDRAFSRLGRPRGRVKRPVGRSDLTARTSSGTIDAPSNLPQGEE